MAENRAENPRQTALKILNCLTHGFGNISEISAANIHLTDRRAQAADISFGVTRNCSIIDELIARISAVRPERIKNPLLNILRIAVYELVFTGVEAEYAIVNEAVKAAETEQGGKSAGFVNAVLRKTCRSINNRNAALDDSDAKKTIPKTSLTGCEFIFDILPAAGADYLSRAFSLPRWLVRQWLDEFGYEKSREICFACNRRSSIYLRPNTLKITAAELFAKFRAENIACELVTPEAMIMLNNPGRISALAGFDDGLFSVQDIGTSTAVKILAPQKGQTIVDLCAAPGGKTTQMAEIMQDSGRIIATDINKDRLKNLAQNCTRLKIRSAEIIDYDKIDALLCEIHNVDAVIIDVPCSNTAVLAKRCEVRHRIKQKQIEELSKIQLQLLKKAASIIGIGGKICYSTCSILKQENSRLIQRFLQTDSGFVLEQEKLLLPSAQKPDRDGGYTAIISKIS